MEPEDEEKPRKLSQRLSALTPRQITVLVVLGASILILLIMTGGFIELLKLLVMLFIELVIRVAKLIFRF